MIHGFGIWADINTIGIVLLYTTMMFALCYFLIPGLRRIVLKTRGMFKIIPSEILTSNKRLRKILLKGKEEDGKRSRMRGRKYTRARRK